jgi:hypothetical protein
MHNLYRYAAAYDEHQKNKGGQNVSLLMARNMARYIIKRPVVPPAPLRTTAEARTRLRALSLHRADLAKFVHPDDIAVMRRNAREVDLRRTKRAAATSSAAAAAVAALGPGSERLVTRQLVIPPPPPVITTTAALIAADDEGSGGGALHVEFI